MIKSFYTPNYKKGDEIYFRFFSDLHLEFDDNFTIPNLNPDEVILLAGDIHYKAKAVDFVRSIASQGVHVVFIAGNHDYYSSRVDKVDRIFKALEDESEYIHFLQNSSVIINDVEFLGGTLWTSLNKSDPKVYREVGAVGNYNSGPHAMNDYKCIKFQEKGRFSKLKTHQTVLMHINAVKYIESRIGKHPKQVVLTHHTPSEIFVDFKRWGDGIEKYTYYSELEYLAENFDYWIAGHTHLKVDKKGKRVHYLSNPRGYFGTDDSTDQVDEFSLNWKIKY